MKEILAMKQELTCNQRDSGLEAIHRCKSFQPKRHKVSPNIALSVVHLKQKRKGYNKKELQILFVENVKRFMLNFQKRYLRKNENKSIIATIWIMTITTFALMKSFLLCLNGSRSLNKKMYVKSKITKKRKTKFQKFKKYGNIIFLKKNVIVFQYYKNMYITSLMLINHFNSSNI